jgi:hypothetical protein
VSDIEGTLTFKAWKKLLEKDCLLLHKEQAFKKLGDGVLRVLYLNDSDPSVDSIVRNGLTGKKSG